MIIPHVHHKTKLPNLAFGVLATLLASFSAHGQTPQERHARIRSAMNAGEVKAALAEIDVLRASNSDILTANNYDYLLGRLQEKTGQTAAANASYQQVVDRQSLLSQYALWHLARLNRATGDLVLERERLRRLIANAPRSLLREAAIMRLSQSLYESKDYDAAAAALRPLSESKNQSLSREALTLTAQSLLAAGKQQQARESFSRLVMQMPDASRPDDFALAGVRGLDAIDVTGPAGSGQGATARLTEAEHLLRASVYQFNRDFDAARRHYVALIERYPQSPTVANALYQTGRGFYLQLKYDEALKYFQRVLDQFPDSMSARDALSFTAGTYNRLKRSDEAVAAYRQFIERFPEAPNPERAYLNIVDALHEAGRHKEALDWVQQTRTRFKGQIGEALALFAQLRIHLAQSAWQEVASNAHDLRGRRDLGGTRVPGGTTSQELTFLRGYALEQLGRTNEAISEYLSIPDGRNEYYGMRSTNRLLSIGSDNRTRPLIETRASTLRAAAEKAINSGQPEEGRRLAQEALRLTDSAAAPRSEMLKLVGRAYQALPTFQLPSLKLLALGRQEVNTSRAQPGGLDPSHQELAEELFFLGLYDEAVPEFAVARSAPSKVAGIQPPTRAADPPERSATVTSPADLDYTLASYSLRGGLANRAVRFGEQLWKNVPADYLLELAPREIVDLLYPLPYPESLLAHASPRGVDPRFVVSIARQESRFQPDAKSVAAARGLMQFIAETSNDIARQLTLNDFTQDHLYSADTAILFGSQYLANLFRQFPAQPQAVAASYNGGPENVARWIARSRSSEPDRYVPELGFSQTKDYVFKVMTNFWIYQQLYDEKLERK